MILYTLTLHNFLSYADATLDLASLPVACLAGANGAGKSALLDAITWALWEKARATSDDLIRHGEREMWIDLIFAHEGQRYRVRRAHQKTQAKPGAKMTSKGTLEFQILNMETVPPSWRSLNASGKIETQKLIRDLLRMDFQTFVNSSYLRQGKADEFAVRMPTERKQILSEILGLSYFDRLQEKARDKVKMLKAQAESLTHYLSELPQMEASLKQADHSFKEATSEFQLMETKTIAAQTAVNSLRETMQQLSICREKGKSGNAQLSGLRFDIETLSRQHEGETKKLDQLLALISHSCEIETRAKEFKELKEKVEQLDHRAFATQELIAEKIELDAHLNSLGTALKFEYESASKKLSEVEAQAEQLIQETSDREKIESSYRQYKKSLEQEAELALKQEDFKRLSSRADQLSLQISEARIRLESEIKHKQAALVELRASLDMQDQLSSEKSALEKETNSLDMMEAEFDLVYEKGLNIKARIDSSQARKVQLNNAIAERQAKICELTEHKDSQFCPLCSSPIVDRQAVINRYEKENETAAHEIVELETQLNIWEDERQEKLKEYALLKKKLDNRKELDKQIGRFNEKLQALSRNRENEQRLLDDINSIQTQLAEEKYAIVERESLNNIRSEISKLAFDPAAYANLQASVRTQRFVEIRHQQLQKDLALLIQLKELLPALNNERAQLSDRLTKENYGEAERGKLQIIQEKLSHLQYDRNEHALLKQKLATLLPETERFYALQKALTERPVLEAAININAAMLSKKREQFENLEKDLQKWQDDAEQLPTIQSRLALAESECTNTRGLKEEKAKDVAVMKAHIEHLQETLAGLDAQRKELIKTQTEIDDYACLAEAFGKKGIQAAIIENAIPEIESEANRILSLLTDNKMHVALRTQKSSKAGTTVETLDLLIGDDIGTRPYELFSGGEAFKINFSVRVALSRLLTRRAGAKLETLIIDEGFGSQDDLSRDRLVRSIQSIQSDFARILIITHIAEIRAMFPAQIQVSKVNGMSQLQLTY